ncbi:aldo/keto reductase [Sphingobium sp. WCS2017Hpa-17]|uniref:aldo/keto reductase n=1 Tax=Sphingobium sp. WCS2017Hpa-17 TaxID=3073638 RepID=UPI00288AE9EF|nr:aldo/keto reductase [Sphingobium sp. WCS2017Hpa-17]
MRYRLLGQSGLRVSTFCLGTMTFGTADWGAAYDEAAAIYGHFRDTGGNFLDTANEIYAEGRSEEIIARLVCGHRDELVIATKYTDHPGGGDPNVAGNHRKSLRRSLERSLRRLGTDYIDLLWVHAWDFTTAPQEVMRALDDMVREGKILHIGISNTPAWLIARCNTLAELRGWSSFAAVQVEYSLAERSAEIETLPMAQALGLSVLAWSPLAMGVLTGKYLRPSGEARRLDQVNYRSADGKAAEVAEMVATIAGKRGCSPAAVALAWLLAQANVSPVIGARTVAQLKDCLGAQELMLEAGDIQALLAVSEPALTAPHTAIQGGSAIIYGGFRDQIDI